MLLDGITRPGRNPLSNPREHSPLVLQHRIICEVKDRKSGKSKSRVIHEGNVLATYGLNRLSEMLISDAGGASDWVSAGAIGTSTTAENSTHVGLFNSTAIVHLSQASMAGSDKGNYTAEWQMTFDDASAYEVHEVGLFATNNATENMIARSELGTDSVNKGTGDTVYISYQIIASTV